MSHVVEPVQKKLAKEKGIDYMDYVPPQNHGGNPSQTQEARKNAKDNRQGFPLIPDDEERMD